jgi:hypothetical protein
MVLHGPTWSDTDPTVRQSDIRPTLSDILPTLSDSSDISDSQGSAHDMNMNMKAAQTADMCATAVHDLNATVTTAWAVAKR